MSLSINPFLICRVCLNVEGVGSVDRFCFQKQPHEWVTADVADCPFYVPTPSGQSYGSKRTRTADEECAATGLAHESHHYGDRFRRHFSVPA